jgi:hypothetical protein
MLASVSLWVWMNGLYCGFGGKGRKYASNGNDAA